MRKPFVVLGLAILLSLLVPVKAVLQAAGVDTANLRVPGADLAALCALVAVVPALLLFRDARMAHRIPAWSVRVALLGLFSLLFLLLHVNWSLDLATVYAREAAAPSGPLPPSISHIALLDALELVARLGVLAALVGVLMQLEAPADDAPAMRSPRRKK